MPTVALTIAGSDPSGGAGIQADLKTFHQFGVFGTAAITLLTVQNTMSVLRVETMSPDLVRQQIEAILVDLPVAAAKTGALGSGQVVEEVAALAAMFTFPLVVDPVMISKHGVSLMSDTAQLALRDQLLPRAFLVTPNIPEAEVLAGISIKTADDVIQAARAIQNFGCPNVLIKGGHGEGEPTDVLAYSGGVEEFNGKRIQTRHTHGTGCTYSAAITAGLAKGMGLHAAIASAKAFIQAAIETAPGLGSGHGPVNHHAASG